MKPFSIRNTVELENYRQSKRFLCEYRFQGSTWAIEIRATSHKEAEERLRQISQGKVLGEVKGKLPVEIGWLVKLWVRVKNQIVN
jgi:hypothetical protein